MKDKKFLISAGGTGGHFYPALAVAEELIALGAQIVFAVRKNDFCIPFLQKADIPYIELDVMPFPRNFNPLKHFSFAAGNLRALRICLNVMADYKPSAVLGMGGYVSFSAVLSAFLKRIPTVLHESNAETGLANKLLSVIADKTAFGLVLPCGKTSRKFVLTGTPVRKEFLSVPSASECRKIFGIPNEAKVILFFGGSQGAKKLNIINARLFSKTAEADKNLYFIHITGKRDYEETKSAYGEIPSNIRLLEYCENMHLAFGAADLIYCRAGASAATELVALKKPAILVPFPYSAGGHQDKNAAVLANGGCAISIKQTENDFETKLAGALGIIENPSKLSAMSSAYGKLSIPPPTDSAKLIAGILIS